MPASACTAVCVLALPVAAAAALAQPAPAAADDVVVFAAASLKNALDDAVATYRDETGKTVLVSYAGTSTLAKQIEQPAPADIFFSADMDWMDYVEERGLIRPDHPAHACSATASSWSRPRPPTRRSTSPRAWTSPACSATTGCLAMANTDAVPAGKYGKAALQTLGAWDGVAGRIVEADNVRTALAFVARGEAPLGIVYATDAAAEPAVKVIGAFPDDSHPPIRYPVAITAASTNPDARAFFDFLLSDAARPAFEAAGLHRHRCRLLSADRCSNR